MPAEKFNYEELQANEIIVLESAYFDNFKRLDHGHSAWKKTEPSFEIRIQAKDDADFALTLHVVFTATYPRSPPLLTLKEHDTLRPAALFKVQKFIETEPQKHVHNDEMMMTIVQGIEDILDSAAAAKRNGNERSLEEERADHEAQLAQQAQIKEQEEHERLLKEQEEEREAWTRQLEDERKRQSESKKNNRQRGSLASALHSTKGSSHNDAPVLKFDELCEATDASGNVSTFFSVTEKIPFKTNPPTTLSKVRPILIEGHNPPSLLLKETIVKCVGKTASQALDQIQHLEQRLIKVHELSHAHIANVIAYKIVRHKETKAVPTWSLSILMPFAERGSLEELLELTGTLNIVKVRAWARDLLDALSYLHNHGVTHQSIHPRNILLFRDERTNEIGLKLSDIGFQREIHQITEQNKPLPGLGSGRSSFWLPPENTFDSRSVKTQKSDVWDFGVVFLQLLFGLDVTLKHESPATLQESMDLSAALREILLMLFRLDPKKRPRAFELSSCEFLATDAPIMARDMPPMPDMNTIATLSSSIPNRLRRDSMTRNLTQSRYAEDFIEEGTLGKGAFGEVVKARKKLDGQFYAIKKVTHRSRATLTETLKEVRLLSRISHPAVVRYYNTWVEEVADISDLSSDSGAGDYSDLSDIEEDSHSRSSQQSQCTVSGGILFEASTSGLDFISTNQPDVVFESDSDLDGKHEPHETDSGDDDETEDDDDVAIEFDDDTDSVASSSRHRAITHHRTMPIRIPGKKQAPPAKIKNPFHTIMYISMEFCDQKTLRHLISRNLSADSKEVWRLFRQILEGLAHIHALQIVHRDLKPENIFVSHGEDGTDNIKIGDFGLATSAHFALDKRGNESHVLTDMKTKSIGTAFYAAPEVSSATRGSYGSKVDMYSLGLIFFEMCTEPCVAAMERIVVTEPLRQSPPMMPETHKPKETVQQDIILSLLTHDPEARPSSSELLKSGLLPVQMESETIKRALAAIADPNMPYYQKILETVFNRPVEALRDYTWSMALTSPSQKSLLHHTVARDTLVEIFRRHGALEMNRSTLFPRSRNYYVDNPAVYTVLDSNGTLLQLPYDLTLSYARFLATFTGPVIARTFSFGLAFRNKHTNGPPHSSGEVDFDIVTTDSLDLALREAETIKVLDEISLAFPRHALSKARLQIGHSNLLQQIFDFCKVSPGSRSAVADILSRLNIRSVSFSKLRSQLRDPSVGLSQTSLDMLARFDWTDQPNKAMSRLKAIFEGTNVYQQLVPTFAHIKEVLEYCKYFKVATKIYINPLSSFRENFYTGGLMFTLLSEEGPKDVIAAGGRYDGLIKAHRPKSNRGFEERHAVGFSLAWERLATQDKPSNKYLKKPAAKAMEDVAETLPTRCDAIVASFDSELLRSSALDVLQNLWAHNINAEIASDARSPEELMSRYRDDSVSWIIIVKPGLLKVKSLWSKDIPDVDVSTGALVSHLRAEMREKDVKSASKIKHAAAHQQPSMEMGMPSGGRNNDHGVKVFVAQTRSKKFNRQNVIDQANKGAAALMNECLEGQILAIETQDRILDMINMTMLSDPESCRRLESMVPMNERDYIRDIMDTLEEYRAKFLQGQGSRHAFIFNFRSLTTIYYDLSR
ncbi:hypothetical protein TD95_000224 [Thielaviopsis punctulata]|uniref:non-specific serine/threonine protein kinase n=1 Tax=Thielaviopsis punctulata TaxID=72032 RepID=A0A0F4ZDR2_9PEZI|nr:hypothetical protein TD95_000224 [Thielaviopsis punctulata]